MKFWNWQLFGEEEETQKSEEEAEAFEKIIKGEYKSAFDARVQKILDGRLKQLRQENERLRQAGEAREQAALAAIGRLENEAEEIQKTYPDFDWEKEMQGSAFARLVQNGIDGRTAYEVVHRQELLAEAMRYGAKTAREQVSRTLSSGGQRVKENGAGSISVLRNDPKGLTSAELADIRRRVQKGEKISF